MSRDRTVTIDLEPIRWRGSPVLTWLYAGVAWFWAIFLFIVWLAVR